MLNNFIVDCFSWVASIWNQKQMVLRGEGLRPLAEVFAKIESILQEETLNTWVSLTVY